MTNTVNEISAGGIVYTKNNGRLLFLLLKDKSGKWTFPKGLVESGEKLDITSIREVQEETGLTSLKLICILKPVYYHYYWEGAARKKTVYYYLFEGTFGETLKPQYEEGIMEVRWVQIDRVYDLIGYKKTNNPLIGQAERIINSDK